MLKKNASYSTEAQLACYGKGRWFHPFHTMLNCSSLGTESNRITLTLVLFFSLDLFKLQNFFMTQENVSRYESTAIVRKSVQAAA